VLGERPALDGYLRRTQGCGGRGWPQAHVEAVGERLRAALADLKSVLSGPSIQVRCLDCGPVSPVARQTTDAGFVRSVLGWLTS
jgi:hypothetical protein